MRICLLSPDRYPANGYPTDPRIALEARGLRDAGHDVILVCRGDETEAGREIVSDLDVDRLPVDASPFDTAGTPEEIGYAATNTHSAFESAVSRIEEEAPIDAVHVHGLALAKTGLDAAEDIGVPAVLDFAADPVARLTGRRQTRRTRALVGRPAALASRALTSTRRLRSLEADYVARADRIVVACEEARARYVRDRDRDVSSEEVRVVRSTVDLAAFDVASERSPIGLDFSPDDEFVATYAGPIVPDRGLGVLVDALAQVAEVLPDARCVVVGRGPAEYEEDLRERASRAGVNDRLTIATRAEPADVPAYLALCDVSVLPFPESEYAETALPGTLFGSFAAGTPAVVGDVSPLRRVVTRADAGIVASESHTDLAAALRVLARDPERAAALGVNGRRASEPGGKFDAARDRLAVSRLYDEL